MKLYSFCYLIVSKSFASSDNFAATCYISLYYYIIFRKKNRFVILKMSLVLFVFLKQFVNFGFIDNICSHLISQLAILFEI